MKTTHKMQDRVASHQQRSTGPLPILVGAVIAFGIGMLGVTGIVRAPTLLLAKFEMSPVLPRDTKPVEAAGPSPHRLGRAETAPLMKTCAPFSSLGLEREVEPGELYRVLQSASNMSRVAAMAGIKQKAIDDTQFATIWADVADCIYRQNGWALCDPDNRALAVEAANTFVRHLATAAKVEKAVDGRDAGPLPRDVRQRAYALQNAESVKGRVLSSIRSQVAEGRLAATDFGMFASPEIKQVVRETKVTGNACAAKN